MRMRYENDDRYGAWNYHALPNMKASQVDRTIDIKKSSKLCLKKLTIREGIKSDKDII